MCAVWQHHRHLQDTKRQHRSDDALFHRTHIGQRCQTQSHLEIFAMTSSPHMCVAVYVQVCVISNLNWAGCSLTQTNCEFSYEIPVKRG